MYTSTVHARFRLFYSAFVVSTLGDSFRLLAVNVWIFQATEGSTTERLVLVLLGNVPGLLLGGFSGVLADRWNKYRILIASDYLRFGVGLGLAWCAYSAQPILALLLVGVGNAFGVFFASSAFAMLPRLVPESGLARANGQLETTQWVVQVVGPSLAAITLANAGATSAFAIDSISFFLSGVILSRLRHALIEPNELPAEAHLDTGVPSMGSSSPTYWTSFLEGLRIIWHNPKIRALLLASYGVTFISASTNFTLIFLVANSLGGDTTSLGFIYSLNGAVAVAAAAATTVFLANVDMGKVLATAMFGLCIAQVVMGLAPNFWVLAVGVAISALANAPYNVSVTTLYMQRVPPRYLGRVEGVDTMVDSAVSIAAYVSALMIVSTFSPRIMFVFSAAVALPSMIVAVVRVTGRQSEPMKHVDARAAE